MPGLPKFVIISELLHELRFEVIRTSLKRVAVHIHTRSSEHRRSMCPDEQLFVLAIKAIYRFRYAKSYT